MAFVQRNTAVEGLYTLACTSIDNSRTHRDFGWWHLSCKRFARKQDVDDRKGQTASRDKNKIPLIEGQHLDKQITRNQAMTPLMEIACRQMAALIAAPGTTEAVEADRINFNDIAIVAVRAAQALLVELDRVQRRSRTPEVVRRDDRVTELRLASDGPDYKAMAHLPEHTGGKIRA